MASGFRFTAARRSHAAPPVMSCPVSQRRGLVCRASAQPQADPKPVESESRRAFLAASVGIASASLLPSPVHAANVVEMILKPTLRPDIDPIDALVKLLDARSTLRQVQELASTPADSEERVRQQRLLPTYARRLREVGKAAPVVASLAVGGTREVQVSELYGGESTTGGASATDPLYTAVGMVLTISGRGIRPEALEGPERAAAAIAAADGLLALAPKEAVDQAQAIRLAR